MSYSELETNYFNTAPPGNQHQLVDLQFQNLRIDGTLSVNNLTGPTFDTTYLQFDTATGKNLNINNITLTAPFVAGSFTGQNVNMIYASCSVYTGTTINVGQLNGINITGTNIFTTSLTGINNQLTNINSTNITCSNITCSNLTMTTSIRPSVSNTINLGGPSNIFGVAYLNSFLTSCTGVSTTTTPNIGNSVINCTGTFNVTLPIAFGSNGQILTINNVGSGTITVGVSAGDHINYTGTSYAISKYLSKSFICDSGATGMSLGTGWWIMNSG